MKKLTKRQITLLNRTTIEENGGQFVPPDNFLHGEQLDYLVDMVDEQLFGQSMYPTLADKAALYMFNIISNHIFSDGNKRTGLTAALVFLYVNDHVLREKLQSLEGANAATTINTYDDQLEQFTLDVASGNVSLDQCRKWFKINVVSK